MSKLRNYNRRRVTRDAYDDFDEDLDLDLYDEDEDEDDMDLDLYDEYDDDDDYEDEMELTPFEKAEAAYMQNSAEELSNFIDSLDTHIKNINQVHLSMGRQGGRNTWSGMKTLSRLAEDLRETRQIVNGIEQGGEVNKAGLRKLQNTLDTTSKSKLSAALKQVRAGRKNRTVDSDFKRELGRLSSSITKVQNAYRDFRTSHGIDRKPVKRPGAGRKSRGGWDDTKLSG